MVFVVLICMGRLAAAEDASTPETQHPAVLHLALPDAPEKQLVEQYCVACHDLARVQNAGRSRSGWTKRPKRMITRGAKLPLQDTPAVAAYLAREFPERPRPTANDEPASERASDAPH